MHGNPVILLLGGASETGPVAEALARAGYRALVSTATEIPLFIGSHPRIEHRRGRMDARGMEELIRARGICAVVDATHPYATAASAAAAEAAREAAVAYLRYERPGCVDAGAGVAFADSHEEAARTACEAGRPVLLTIGSRNVAPYAAEARRAGVTLVARVLDHPESHQACREAGIDCMLSGRGPFSVEENRRVIREHGIGALVTKDSGEAGGVREKLEAARLEGCAVIVVRRLDSGEGFSTIAELVREVNAKVPPPPFGVLAMDLESVLVPEIWEEVASATGVPELALTTRDIPDYGNLMRERIRLCRERGLTLTRLREIVTAMKPLLGAREFFAWAQHRARVVIVSDTFHELADPLLAGLGSPELICNTLEVDAEGYITGYAMRDAAGKAGAIADFQRLGRRVAAVGDSFNDLAMLEAADAPFLFRPAPRVLESGIAFPPLWTFDELQTAIARIIS